MYKTRKKVYFLVINAAVLLLSVFVSVLLVQKDVSDKSPVIFAAVPALVFLMLLIAGSSIRHGTDKLLRKKYLESGETAYIDDFIEGLRFCYSYEDPYKAFAEILEIKADCSVLLIDREKNYVLYNSPNRISSYSETVIYSTSRPGTSWRFSKAFLNASACPCDMSASFRWFFCLK